MTTQQTGAISFKRVNHRFGTTLAVADFNLAIEEKEIFCLVGPSGCGKSTTLRLAAGLERLQSGTIHIGGRLAADAETNLPPEQRGIGFVFQDFALFPHLSVGRNVAFGLKADDRQNWRKLALQFLSRVHLDHLIDAYPHQLSGGEQQRVALARALATRPTLVLLDEPFSGLDTRLRDAVRDDTLALLRESNTPALLVTHDPAEAMRLADRIGIMRKGVLEQQASPAELYNNPASDFAAAFLGPVNRLSARISHGSVATPFGNFPAKGLSDGTNATIVIRQEAFSRTTNDGAASPMTVVASKFLGAASEVVLHVGNGQPHLTVLLQGPAPNTGEQLFLSLDRSRVFVFSAD